MATVVRKTTFEIIRSVNTPDYPSADWLINPPGLDALLAGSVPVRYWKIVGSDLAEQTQAEKDATDSTPSIVAAHRETQHVANELAGQLYLNAHYDAGTRDQFHAMLCTAQVEGLTNRQAYVQSVFDWITSVSLYLGDLHSQVDDATTVLEVLAITPNLTPFDATDPGRTTAGAFETQDPSPSLMIGDGTLPLVIDASNVTLGNTGNLDPVGRIDATGGYPEVIGPFVSVAIVAPLSNSQLGFGTAAVVGRWIPGRAGCIRWISCSLTIAAAGADLTVQVFKNGSAAGMPSLVVVAGTQHTISATFDVGTYPFVAGTAGALDVRISVPLGWTSAALASVTLGIDW